jgi:hypothetical protein
MRVRIGKRNGAGALALAFTMAVTACASDGPFAPRAAVELGAREVFSLQNAWSGFAQPTRRLVTNEAEWAATWATLHANVEPKPALPEIDFGSSVLVVVAMGSRPTSGYSVIVEDVRAHRGVFYVTVRERSPGPSCGAFQAITQPVHVVEVARQGTTARFEVQRETFACP